MGKMMLIFSFIETSPVHQIIIPSYLAKGLEFDVALIYGANKADYPLEFKQLFYVACTRALHKLNIYYTQELTPIIR